MASVLAVLAFRGVRWARIALTVSTGALTGMLLAAVVMGIADGPTEVHKSTIARQVMKGVEPAKGLWPSEHLPERTAAARARFAHLLEHEVGNS